MDHSQPTPSHEDSRPPGFYNDSEIIEIDGGDGAVRRPTSPETIAAVKRYYERMGRKPPPPYDKL